MSWTENKMGVNDVLLIVLSVDSSDERYQSRMQVIPCLRLRYRRPSLRLRLMKRTMGKRRRDRNELRRRVIPSLIGDGIRNGSVLEKVKDRK